ncbi:PREDICTED: nectin-4, partial [Calidris pugnax]|uniref:nectin-4 n=1 Tax=Calidris pugnax TaxID=198806 RepID=UPI00071D9527
LLALLGLALYTAGTLSLLGPARAAWRFSWSYILGWVGVVLTSSAGAMAGVVEMERSVTAVLGQDVVLPCRYRAQEREQVEQVTWLKRGPDGHSAEVAVLHRQHGQHVQERYAGRVLRQADGALEDGAIVLRNAVQGDEGDYECHLITFPLGSFEGHLTLKVLVPPLPILNPGPPLEEGQGRTLAASCTAEGNPVPSVRWETEVRGTNATRHNEVRKVDLVSASVVVVGVIAAVLLCVLVIVVVYSPLHPPINPSIGGCIHPPTHPSICPWMYSSLHQPIHPPMNASIHGCIHPSICPWMYPSLHPSINPSIPPWIHPRIHPSVHLFMHPPTHGLICPPTHPFPSLIFSSHPPADNEVRKVDLVSASVVVVGVIAAVLLCVLVIVVVVMTLYHKRKTKRISEK